ncbi:MAG: glycosyltransferase family 4 protein [Pirellulales bacterium]|nr:glycosyltransferase family 4 protein [Pirellulales bacterium]
MSQVIANQNKRIGFISTRISGNDGVSLEIGKWAEVLQRLGHSCFYIAGQSDRPEDISRIIPEAHFSHPVIDRINHECFGCETRTPELSEQIHEMTWVIKEKLHTVLKKFELDLIIAENCLTIPMNIPLGLALVETVIESGIHCIAHHHDFVWERERFLVNSVDDFLHAAFPPPLAEIQHVVINSQAGREFSRNTGLPCRIIHNVMDFENPPQPPDEYSDDFQQTIGLAPDDILILQPTRVVPRKGIEHSVELVRQLDSGKCKLVISHSAGDEGQAYTERIRNYAKLMGVSVVFADPWIHYERGINEEGQKQYTIWDAYQHADLVTYPSTYEGFGNAFLEAIYYKKPILCNRYGIYRTDIEPCGFNVILMDGFLTEDVVDQVRRVLNDKNYVRELTDHNYEVASRYFSYKQMQNELQAILNKPY